MALFKRTALASAILTIIAANSIYAAENVDSDSMKSKLMNDSFVSDSQLDLILKNYYRKNEADFADSASAYADGWAQSVQLNYESGWFMNWFGLDASANYSLRLASNKARDVAVSNLVLSSGLLAVNSDMDQVSYGSTSYAAKINLMDYGVIKYGRMLVDTPLLSSSTEFSLPRFFEGFYGELHWQGLKGYATHLTKLNTAGAGFDTLRSTDGTEYKKAAIKLYGAEYHISNFAIRANQTDQKDWVKYTYADAAYTMPMQDMGELMLGVQYGKNAAQGRRKDVMETNNGDPSLSWGGGMLNWKFHDITTGLGHVHIGDESGTAADTSGFASARLSTIDQDQQHYAGNTFVGYTAGLVDDFAHPGESSTKVNFGYDFSSMVQGLSVSASYIWGMINYSSGSDNHNASEYDAAIIYQLAAVKGLSAKMEYGHYEEKWDTTAGVDRKTSKDDTRVIVNYTVDLF